MKPYRENPEEIKQKPKKEFAPKMKMEKTETTTKTVGLKSENWDED